MALLQLGLQREKAGRVGILNNSIVIFTYIFQISLTNDKGNGSINKICVVTLPLCDQRTPPIKTDKKLSGYLSLVLH